MKTISATINQGQLIIPEAIRKVIKWANFSVVSVSVGKPDEIRITPAKNKIDWEILQKKLKRVRAFKGQGEGNLSKFILHDRERHY